MNDDFRDLLTRLIETQVDFVLVGGFAGVVHGCSCVTQDIEICCDFSPENLLALLKAVSNLHPGQTILPRHVYFTASRIPNLQGIWP